MTPENGPRPVDLGRFHLVASYSDQIREDAERGKSRIFGLTGPWGSGKSWLLERMMEHLKSSTSDSGDIVVEFNPWIFPDETALYRGFTLMLLGRDALRRKWRHWFAVGIGLIKADASFWFFGAGLAPFTDKLANSLSPIGSPKAMREAIANAMNLRGRRVFVVMDDLDRLSPGELLTVFRLVRLLGDIPNLHYILAYDQDTVLRLLDQTDVSAGDPSRSEQYLEKIVETRIPVPTLTTEQIEALAIAPVLEWARSVDPDLSEGDEAMINLRLASIVFRCVATPRAAQRYLSTVRSLRPQMVAEVRLEHWVLACLLRTFFPRVWELAVSERDLLTGVTHGHISNRDEVVQDRASRLRDRFAALLGDVPIAVDILILLELLFPAYDRLVTGGNKVSADFDPNSSVDARGIGHPAFFHRYVWPDIPPGHVPEGEVRAYLRALPAPDASTGIRRLFTSSPLAVIEAIERNFNFTRSQPVERVHIVELCEQLYGPAGEVSPMAPHSARALLTRLTARTIPWMSPEELGQFWNPTNGPDIAAMNVFRDALTDPGLLRDIPDKPLKGWVASARQALRDRLAERLKSAPSPSLDAPESRRDFVNLLRLDAAALRNITAAQHTAGSWSALDIAGIYVQTRAGNPSTVYGISIDQLERDLGPDLLQSLIDDALSVDVPDEGADALSSRDGIPQATENINRIVRAQFQSHVAEST
ncbi:MAG: hypothetical protein EPO52_06525 [Herbiconiux sp.]|uniref:KAP family P-loop NTPase fold protein n=1 Tax=Herbiconiux sp. TaxID=1871186 RepID=UPI0012027C35|nr:P-loop NTPase fold protein [Herbiconiux sp.]TAJ47853.1 MAG: hypothetical protein EPO52_06525 [Herbiconiux sp.]